MSGRARTRRRRWYERGSVKALGGLAALAVLAAVLIMVFDGTVHKAINELTLPLQHEDIIRQQAKEKGVDAALIAAVIDTESKFSDTAVSSAGARGLMQVTPEAAKDIARHSGATSFKTSDLSNPEINIRYGTYLLAERIKSYDGDVVAALASYNAGPVPVEKWGGDGMTVDDITYPETRAYVELVLERQKEYREKYGSELGYG
jgi:soluble lytic murein transglycosylase